MLIVGTDQGETLNGSAGDDEIFGRKGDDVVNGLGGNDLIYWSTGTDTSTSDGGDFTDGGTGTDRFLVISGYTLLSANGYTYSQSYRLEAGGGGLVNWTMKTTGQFGAPTFDMTETSVVNGMRNVETFSFSGVHGPAQQGGLGSAESIFVGDLRGTELTGLLFFDLGAGVDTLDADGAYNQIVALGGDGNDQLFGGAANDELQGGDGNDLLVGNGGTNTLIGGAGNDTYTSNSFSDSVVELGGEGTDALLTGATFYILQANVENLTFIGTGAFTGLGNEQNNVIEGHDAGDYLIGFGGDDVLYGRGGTNTLQGGLGNDVYHVQTQNDTVYELAGEGTDTVYTTSLVYTLTANVENLREESPLAGVNWTGNGLDNVILGSAVADTLSGLGGNDILDAGLGGNNAHNVMRGGLGDDTFRLGSSTDEVIELAGEGNDTVELRVFTSYTLPDNIENLLIGINQNTVTHGNLVANQMTGGTARDNMSGDAGDDTLYGGLGNDFLSGEAGNDVVNGGQGADELAGGSGADLFAFDDAVQDLVHDFSHADGDKVYVGTLLASVGYSGSDPFADGYLRVVDVPALPPSGQPVTRLEFDPDGSAGPQSFDEVAVFLGGTGVITPQDVIWH